MRSGLVHRRVSGGSSSTSRRPENGGLQGRLREIPWLEVGVNSRQLDRSCCGVFAQVVGFVTRFGNSPSAVRLHNIAWAPMSLPLAPPVVCFQQLRDMGIPSVASMYKTYKPTAF